MHTKLKCLKVMAIGLLAAASAQAGSFKTDFSTDPTTVLNFGGSLWDGVTTTGTGSANWQTNGGAGPFGNTTNGPVSGVPGDGFLQITFADHSCMSNLSSSLCGGVLFDDFDNGLVVAGFTFDADLRIGNGDPNPADGFSINYVRDTDPILAALKAGDTFPDMNGHISPSGGQFEDNGSSGDLSLMEEGASTGLAIGFDMWDSGAITIPPAFPAIGLEANGITHDYICLDIRVDGVLLTTIQMPNGTTGAGGPGATATTASDPTAIETGPYDGSGCDTILSWVHFKVNLDVNGVLNIYWKNHQILTNLQTTYFPSPGRLLMAARVGGNTANIEIDNIEITTLPAPVALVGGAVGFPDGFQVKVENSGVSVLDTNQPITLTLDGSNVVATAITSIGGLTILTYHGFPALIPPGSTNQITVSAFDTHGSNIVGSPTFVEPPYAILNTNLVVTGVNTNDIGFKVKAYQTAAPNSGPTFEFAELQQAGMEGTNTANLTQTIDGSAADTNGFYTITNVINWADIDSAASVPDGDFSSNDGYGDREFPGMPPTGGDQGDDEYYNLSEQLNGFIYFPAPGVYQLGVNSADGFKATSGRNPADQFAAVILGSADTKKGASDVLFNVAVNKAGYYPFRVLYFDGSDAASCELFTVVNGIEYLLNDPSPTNTSGVKAYFAGPALPGYASSFNPSVFGAVITLTDGATTITSGSVTLNVNGTLVTPTVTKAGAVTTVTYTGAAPFASGSSQVFALSFTDSAGVTSSGTQTYVVPTYTAVPANITVTGISTNDVGFLVRPYQSANSTTTPTALQELAGQLGTNNANLLQTLSGLPIDTNGYYTWTNEVNWNQASLGNINNGNFTDNNGYTDAEFPGMPPVNAVGATSDYTDLAEDVLCFLYFPAPGVYEMGGNTDDGFEVYMGTNPKDALSAVALGGFNGGRGSADTDFNVLIPAAGYYPTRFVYYNGGGGANCEWFTFQNGVRYLINDPSPTNTTGIRAYYAGPSLPPYVASTSGTITNATFVLDQSGSATITPSTVKILVNGYTGSVSVNTVGGVTTATFTVTNAIGFASGSTNTVTLIYGTSTGQTLTNSISLVTPTWASIPGSLAVTGVDTTKPGFKIKPFLSANSTTIASAEMELAGLNGTNQCDLTQVLDGFPIDANGYYTWTNVINWDEIAAGTSGNHDGHFQPSDGYPDFEFPGMPKPGSLAAGVTNGLASSAWNDLEEEVLTFVSFPAAGFYTMGVNSDDGFNLSVGANPAVYPPALVLGDFNGGRGSSDSDFSFYVQAAGTYRFRLLYFNGGGGANCEWTSINAATGVRYLVNDPSPTNTTGITAYYSGPALSPALAFTAPVLSAGKLTLNWTGTATLQQATSITPADWTDVTPAPTGNTYTVTVGASGNLFYRLKQ